MKNIIAASLLLISISAGASQFKSFAEIKREFDSTGDMQRISYLFYRCASLWSVHSALAARGGDTATEDKFKNAAAQYMLLADMMEEKIDKDRKTNRSEQERTKSAIVTVQLMSDEYQKKMNRNYALTGHYIISDPDLRGEVEHCKSSEKLVKWLADTK